MKSRLEKSLLEQLYWKEGLPIRQIAKRLDKSKFAIQYWMNKHEIPRRSFKIKSSLRERLIEMYKKGESTWSIAKELKIAKSSVLRYLKERGIKIRSRREAAKLGISKGRIKIQKHIIPLDSKLLTKEKAYIMGVLCGDGCLCYIPSKRLYQISLEVADKDFAQKFAQCLYKVYGIKVDIDKLFETRSSWKDKFRVRLCCKDASENLLNYGTTYKTFEWKVPEAIKQSPKEIIAEFIKGFADSESDVDIDSRRIGLTSFRKEGLEEIKELLKQFEIRSVIVLKSKKYYKGFVLRIQDRKSVEKFAKFIGFSIKRKQEALMRCISSYKLYKTLKEDIEEILPDIIAMRNKGYSYETIAQEFGVSTATVWRHLKNNIRGCTMFPRDRNRITP